MTVEGLFAARRAGAACAVAAALSVPAGTDAADLAQDVEVRAFASPPRVTTGSEFEIRVEVSGTQRLDEDPEAPQAGDFARYRGSSTSTSFQMTNGRASVSLTYSFRFQAVAPGDFAIEGVEVVSGGRAYRTDPISVVVADAPAGGASPESEEDGIAREDLFVDVEVSSRRAFENEPVIVEYRLYTRLDVESYTVLALPQATGFWAEELERSTEPRTERVVRDGLEYTTAVVRRVALFPTGAGPRTVDPMRLEVQVRRRDRPSFDPFRSLLGSSLFDRRIPATVASDPFSIDVAPLPEEGRPASFGGHVGALDVEATVDRSRVEAHEAITLSVSVAGTGNLRALAPPDVDLPDEFEVFPPQIEERIAPGGGSVQGTRRFAYVLVPRAPGRLTIPAVEVSYFDAAAGRYGTSRSSPLTIEVAADASAGPGGVSPTAVESVREEIRHIHTDLPDFRRVDSPTHRTAGFWIVLLTPLAGVAAAAARRRHLNRIESDAAYARLRRAPRVAKRRLARARKLAAGDPGEFHGEVAGALQGFLADRLDVSEAGLVRGDVERIARRRGVSRATLREVFACLDECDRQRFAPPSGRRESARELLERVARAMGSVARETSA